MGNDRQGAVGELDLIFRRRTNGQTYLAKRYFKLPMQVLQPFYQDKDGCAFLYLLNPSGGILQNDVMTTKIVVEKNAKALVTTPANTKYYKMELGPAKLTNEIDVMDEAEMEYIPEHNVPFAKSKVFQETTFNIAESAKLIAFDMVTSGRLARGEKFFYDIYSSKVKIFIDGELKLYENARLEPIKNPLNEVGKLEDNTINASIYFYQKDIDEEKVNKEITDYFNNEEATIGGVTFVSNGLGIIRILGNEIMAMQECMNECWGILRREMLGKDKIRIRKY